VLGEAAAILEGRFRLFSWHEVAAGFPPDWHWNPLTGESAPLDRHWSELGDFAFGDIKNIWELSRFPWAFVLARAYARTHDERFAGAFWALFEDWMAKNPPNAGVNWKCGQEATFRLMAAIFAVEVMSEATATNAVRREQFGRFVHQTGSRIAGNLTSALSQKNNHGVSECVGLITAALLLPEAPESRQWQARGRRELEAQVEELVYADGSFAQHSLIYHRLVVDVLSWVVCRLRRAGQTPPDRVIGALDRATRFLATITDPVTGGAPLFGANDGANVLPLADGEFPDLRASLQAGTALARGELLLAPGPWDEAVGWLVDNGANLRRGPQPEPPEHWHAPEGGYFQWTSGDSRLFLRCPTAFRHRPSQADLLHVDVWWRGRNIVRDAGSFSYNTSGPFAGALQGTAVHNTVGVDGRDQMQKGGRFLYLPWPHGTVSVDGATRRVAASHDGYRRLGVTHVRTIALEGTGGWRVSDRMCGRKRHVYRLHWLLADGGYEFDVGERRLAVRYPEGIFELRWDCSAPSAKTTLVRADPVSSRGWIAPCYQAAEPALSLAVEVAAEGEVWFETVLKPA
jgi:hypothetical protein